MSEDRGGDSYLERLEAERNPDVGALDRERAFFPPPMPRHGTWGTPPAAPRADKPGRWAEAHAELAAWAASYEWEPELVSVRDNEGGHVVVGRDHTGVVTLCGALGEPRPADTGYPPCVKCRSFRGRA